MAVGMRDEEPIRDLRREEGRLETRLPRRRDRAGGEPRILIRVVGRIDGEVAIQHPPRAHLHRILHRRVGLERHADLQPIEIDRGDRRALGPLAHLLLHDRCQGHHLVARHLELREPRIPRGIPPLLEPLHHLRHHVPRRHLRGEVVGLGEEIALDRRRPLRHAEPPEERRVAHRDLERIEGKRELLADDRERFPEGEPLADRHPVDDPFAGLERVKDPLPARPAPDHVGTVPGAPIAAAACGIGAEEPWEPHHTMRVQ